MARCARCIVWSGYRIMTAREGGHLYTLSHGTDQTSAGIKLPDVITITGKSDWGHFGYLGMA